MKEWNQDVSMPRARYCVNTRKSHFGMSGIFDLTVIVVLATATVLAMPTQEEMKQVEPLVNELMAKHLKDFSAKKISANEVGDAVSGFVKEAVGEAAKYRLLKGAIYYYAIAGEWDKAADALETIKTEVADVPTTEIMNIASRALERAGKNDAQRMRTIYRAAYMQSKAEADVKMFKAALRKERGDVDAMRGLADAYVRLGDWPRALKLFAKLNIAAADFELKPSETNDYTTLKAADYWWNVKAKDVTPYRAHAAALYKKAIGEGLVRGLMKPLVEKRIAEVEAYGKLTPQASSGSRRYCIIDLSAGPDSTKYPVSYLDGEPKNGWANEYKTTKLVLRRIEPGTFIMGKDQKDESHRVTLTKPFYMGVFEVTQKQYELVTGDNPSKHKGDMRPVDNISWEGLRGPVAVHDWPKVKTVANDTFIGRIRARTRMEGFDLPTEAQWEYACRAGTTTSRYDGSQDTGRHEELGRIMITQTLRGFHEPEWHFKKHQPDGKGDYSSASTSVGMYPPNPWGLYDMYGNVSEWCVSYPYDSWGRDPVGGMSDPKGRRVSCSGSWFYGTHLDSASSFWRIILPANTVHHDHGFRLALSLE